MDPFSSVLGNQRGRDISIPRSPRAARRAATYRTPAPLMDVDEERFEALACPGGIRLEDLYGENAGVIIAAVRDVLVRGYTLLGDRRRGRKVADEFFAEACRGDYRDLIDCARGYLNAHLELATEPYEPAFENVA